MNQSESIGWSPKIAQKLYQILIKSIPPKSPSSHLKDLVVVLTNALAKGELKIDLSTKYQPQGIKEPGWPESHRQELFESGWLDGDVSPMILEGSQLSWRRWHTDINSVILDLWNRSQLERKIPSDYLNQNRSTPIERLNKEQTTATPEMIEKTISTVLY